MALASSSPAAGGGSPVDSFLHVQTKRAGKIKGEATNPKHVDDILVLAWRWGLDASSAIGSTQATGRRSYTSLVVEKHIDLATTALMAALATNDEVKEARLTLRRAGGEQEEYFVITLKGARVVSVHHDPDPDGHPRETVAIAFTKIEVKYEPQQNSGLRGGTSVFTDELIESA